MNSVPLTSYEPDKLLGIQWIHHTDEFKFYLSELKLHAKSLPVSKCSVLHVTAAIFDPVRFLNPFVIQLKIMFQKLCKNKSHWDEPLPTEPAQAWGKLRNTRIGNSANHCNTKMLLSTGKLSCKCLASWV